MPQTKKPNRKAQTENSYRKAQVEMSNAQAELMYILWQKEEAAKKAGKKWTLADHQKVAAAYWAKKKSK